MALSPEMQAVVEQSNAIEDNRSSNVTAQETRRAKLEIIRMAKEILVENRRTQTASEATAITANAITLLAIDLNTFVNT